MSRLHCALFVKKKRGLKIYSYPESLVFPSKREYERRLIYIWRILDLLPLHNHTRMAPYTLSN